MVTVADGNLRGKRVVVFGCGYVGSEVVRQAVVRGMRATALTRNTATCEALRSQGAEVVVADLAGRSWHSRIAGGADFVLNCVSAGGGGIEAYRHSYVDGMDSIVAWARERGPAKTFIYTGSTSVYPQGGGVRVDESAEVGGSERANLLLAAEARVREGGGAWERWFILRLAGIYGPGRSPLLDHVRAGEVAGSGAHHLNLAYRDDIVASTWAAFSAPAGVANEILNVADDCPTQKQAVAAWLAARLGLPPPRFTGAPAAGRQALTPDRVIANDRIKERLGWRPGCPSFREGYEKILSL